MMSDFRDILREIGEFGLFQKRLVAALCLPTLFTAFDVIGQVFVGLPFPHHCNTDWILQIEPNLTQFVFGLVELPARVGSLPMLQRFGRRICQTVVLVVGGVACLVIIAIPKELPVAVTVIAVLGKFAATACFSIVYVYSAELYPTIIRQNGVGLNAMCARVAGILAPLIRLLDSYQFFLPMLIYGTVPILAGGLCLMLPETLNVELQDHTEMLMPDKKTKPTDTEKSTSM